MLHDGKKKAFLAADLTFKRGESFLNADDIERGNVIKVEFDDKQRAKECLICALKMGVLLIRREIGIQLFW